MAAKKRATKETRRAEVAEAKWPLAPCAVDERTLDLGRAWWPLIACASNRGVLTSWIDGATAWVDLAVWPPAISPFVSEWTRDARRSRDGTWAFLVGWKQQRLLVLRQDEVTPVEIRWPSKKVGYAAITFVGGRVVAIPGPLGHENHSSPLMCGKELGIESNGALVPAASDASGGAGFELCGGVSLLDGSELVIWSGRVFAWHGTGFVRAAPDLPRGHANFGFTAVPYADGFFCAAGRRLLFVRRGEDHVQHAAKLESVVAISSWGEDLVITTLGPLAYHRYNPRTGDLERLDMANFACGASMDIDRLVYESSMGVIASADQSSRLVRLSAAP